MKQLAIVFVVCYANWAAELDTIHTAIPRGEGYREYTAILHLYQLFPPYGQSVFDSISLPEGGHVTLSPSPVYTDDTLGTNGSNFRTWKLTASDDEGDTVSIGIMDMFKDTVWKDASRMPNLDTLRDFGDLFDLGMLIPSLSVPYASGYHEISIFKPFVRNIIVYLNPAGVAMKMQVQNLDFAWSQTADTVVRIEKSPDATDSIRWNGPTKCNITVSLRIGVDYTGTGDFAHSNATVPQEGSLANRKRQSIYGYNAWTMRGRRLHRDQDGSCQLVAQPFHMIVPVGLGPEGRKLFEGTH